MLASGKCPASASSDRLPQVFTIEGLRQRLQGEHVIVFVDDEAGKQVGLAKNDAVGIGIAHSVLAESNRGGDALAQQSPELLFGDFVTGQEADRDLGCAAVKRRSQPTPTLITHLHQRAGRSVGRRHQIGTVHPQVSASQARRAAMVDGYDWNGIGQGALARKSNAYLTRDGRSWVSTSVILSEERSDESKDPYDCQRSA